MHILVYFLGVVWISLCFAEVEIATEGEHGWAQDLPTWRLPRSNWVSQVFFNGKPATGYHVWMETFILSMMHFVYVYMPFSISTELGVLAFFCFFSIVEDFLWFALNPAWGVKKFRKGMIPWHKKWLWIAPPDYFFLLAVGSALYAASLYLSSVI
ncbi:MAG TPA: hypothetical protein VMV50_00910 [Candidatus Paceibacterota bacterium]|nr:hypothetical protein [Candidatus Paceibacterota bacterium]